MITLITLNANIIYAYMSDDDNPNNNPYILRPGIIRPRYTESELLGYEENESEGSETKESEGGSENKNKLLKNIQILPSELIKLFSVTIIFLFIYYY